MQHWVAFTGCHRHDQPGPLTTTMLVLLVLPNPKSCSSSWGLSWPFGPAFFPSGSGSCCLSTSLTCCGQSQWAHRWQWIVSSQVWLTETLVWIHSFTHCWLENEKATDSCWHQQISCAAKAALWSSVTIIIDHNVSVCMYMCTYKYCIWMLYNRHQRSFTSS